MKHFINMILGIFCIPWKPVKRFISLLEEKKFITIFYSFLILFFSQLVAVKLILPINYLEKGISFNLVSKTEIIQNFIFAPIYYFLTILICSYILYIVGNLISQIKLNYLTILNITLLGSIVDCWGYLFRIPFILHYKTTQVYFGLYHFINDSDSFISNILKFGDILLIWKYIIIGIGLSIYYKSNNKIKYILLALFFLLIYGTIISLIRTSLGELHMYR